MKLLLRIAHSVRRLYWKIARPKTRGVRAIIVNKEGEILLVRHTYEDGWFLPGGKVRRKEGEENGLRRELYEELGIHIEGALRKLGEYDNTREYKHDTIAVFVVDSFIENPQGTSFEIGDRSFFNPRSLPDTTSPGTRRRIMEWLDPRNIDSRW